MPNANTITMGTNSLTIIPNATFDTDIDMATYFTNTTGIRLTGIKFWGSAANAVLIVRDRSATGPEICKMKDVTPSGVADAFDRTRHMPYIKADEQTLGGTKSDARIIITWA